ncbi:MAG: hypothetical protein GX879_04325, partial [Bacteroidales bacterium]|nr:hypothetical protein [Bacteroidales bacterium]
MNNKNTKNYNKNKTNFSKQVKLFSNKVLRYFAKHPTKSFNHKQIASRLQISSQHDREIIKQSLAFLVQEKKLKETQPGKYKFLSAKIQIQGKLDVSRRGHAQLLSDEYS